MKSKVIKTRVEEGIFKFEVDGKSRFEVRVAKVVNKKKYSKYATVPNLTQARIRRKQLYVELDRDINRPTSITFGEFMETYLDEKKNELGESTIYNRRLTLENKFCEEFGLTPLGEITPAILAQHFGKVTENRSFGTKSQNLKTLKGLFDSAVIKGLIQSNPCIGIKFKKKKDEEFEPLGLQHEQVQKLLDATKKENLLLHYHVALAVYTAARAGELRALSWQDIDFTKRQIVISKNEDPRTGQIKRPKSGKGRVVPINGELMILLRELKELAEPDPSAPVLPYWKDFARNDQARVLKIYCAALGLPLIRFHDLRATAIMLMLNDGQPMTKVMNISGHNSLKAFQKYLRLAGVEVDGGTDCLTFNEPK